MSAGASSVGGPHKVGMTGTLDEAYCPACDRSYGVVGDHCPHDGTRLIRLGRDPMLNRDIDGRFIVRERIGAGGMGVVYRAWQESVRRDVAVKVMKFKTGIDMVVAKRFLREARLASQLAHPSTVAVIDFGQTGDEVLYLVMELLRGKTLAELLAQEERFGTGRACRIAIQLAEALEAAHSHDIVHRDLKPANVMILDEPAGRDQVKVLDFGLAKAMHDTGEEVTVHTMSGNLLGTPTYMAPEMATGAAVDARSDLYAVGVILYEMLAGKPPFVSTSLHQLIAMHASQSPPALADNVPPELAAVITRLLAKDPAHRVQTARELREALDPFVVVDGSGRFSTAPGFATGSSPHASPLPALAVATPGTGTAAIEAAPLPLPLSPTAPDGPPPVDGARLAALRGYTSLRSARQGRTVIGAVIAVGALLAIAIALLTSETPAGIALAPEPALAGAAPMTDDLPSPEVPAAPAGPVLIDVPITSSPSRATVELEGAVLGLTPLTLQLAEGSTVSLRFSLKGHKGKTVAISADGVPPAPVKLSKTALVPFVKP